MASEAARLFVLIDAKITGLERGLARAEARSAQSAKRIGQHGAMVSKAWSGVKLAGAAGLAVGLKKTVDQTVTFDKAMRNVNSIAQLGERRFQGLSKSVLGLAGKTAQGPTTLAEGLYDLVSSGFDARESLLVLKSSAKAATAGLTDTATSTKAVAAVLNAYQMPAAKAKQVSDILFKTVDRGVISFESLAQNVGDVLPFATALGVNLQQVGAATATMTKAGVSGPETMTRIKGAMVALIKPSKDLSAVYKDLGVTSGQELIRKTGSFQGALQALSRAVGGNKEKLADLFPDIRGLGGALLLTGRNAKSATADLEGMNKSSGATSKALSQQSKSVAYQWNKLKAEASALAITVGSDLVPSTRAALKSITDFIRGMQSGKGAGGDFRQVLEDTAAVMKALWPVVRSGAIVVAKLVGNQIALAKALARVYSVIADKVLGAFSSMLRGIADLARLAGKIPGVGGKFRGLADDADSAADKIDGVRESLRGVKSKTVTLKVKLAEQVFDFSKGPTAGLPDIGNTPLPKPKPRPRRKEPPIASGARAPDLIGALKRPTARAAGEAGGAELGSLQSALAWVKANYPGSYEAMIEDAGGSNQHLHIADPRAVEIGRKLQSMGFGVGENPAFGGVGRVHAPNSWHYKGQAIDVNADYRSLRAGGAAGGGGASGPSAVQRAAAEAKRRLAALKARKKKEAAERKASLRAQKEAAKALREADREARSFSAVESKIERVDLRTRAGQFSEAEGIQRKIGLYTEALGWLKGLGRLQALAGIEDLKKELAEVNRGPDPPEPGEAPRFADLIADALSLTDLKRRAGDLTDDQARAESIAMIQGNLGNPDLSERERLELRAELRELTAAVAENTQAQSEQVDLLKEQRDLARRAAAISDTQAKTAMRALTDIMRGELTSGYAGRRLTPGFGSVTRS